MVFYDFAAVAVKLPKPPPAGQGWQGDGGSSEITGAGYRQPAGSSSPPDSSSAISSARPPCAECRGANLGGSKAAAHLQRAGELGRE
jgi:hypothetical protein